MVPRITSRRTSSFSNYLDDQKYQYRLIVFVPITKIYKSTLEGYHHFLPLSQLYFAIGYHAAVENQRPIQTY